MAIIHTEQISAQTVLALWRITESDRELERLCTEEEVRYASQFKQGKRRIEWLAWHALLHELLWDVTTRYNAVGAPVLVSTKNTSQHALPYISVSHTQDTVAVMLSDSPCAVDVESSDRDFGRTARRYLHDEEAALSPRLENDFLGLIWCAKEALYKWNGELEVEFKEECRILCIDPLEKRLHGRIRNKEMMLYHFQIDQLLVVYCNTASSAPFTEQRITCFDMKK